MARIDRRPTTWLLGAVALGGLLTTTIAAAHARRDAAPASVTSEVTPAESSPSLDEATATEAASTAADGTKRGGRPTRRLPTHYNKLVTSEQREKIYRIQDRYLDKIALIEAKLAELKSALGREIEGVLTPEQRAQLKELKKGATP